MGLLKRRRASAERAGGGNYSVLCAGMTVFGDIETDGTVRVDGKLEGTIRRAGVVIIGAGATILGNVSAREVIVGGTVQGNISAAERAEVQSSATVTGDIEAGTVLIHEGSAFCGRLRVRSMAEAPSQAALPPAVESPPRLPSPTPRAMRIAPPAVREAS